MQLTIDTQKDNPLLERIYVTGKISFEGSTPSNNEVIAEVVKKIGSKEELLVIKNIYTQFSRKEAKFSAVVYNSTEARAKVERMTKHIRKQQEASVKKAEEEKKAAEEQPAEENAEKQISGTAQVTSVRDVPIERSSGKKEEVKEGEQ